MSDEKMKQELIQVHMEGKYYLYDKKDKLDSMSHEELETEYMNMRNYLSDSATHTNY